MNCILICGFNNWGKTTIISRLFNKSRFSKSIDHKIGNQYYTVIPQSNDDLGEKGFIKEVNDRINLSPSGGINIFAAFCPTKELNNDSFRIIQNTFSSYQLHIVYIQHKWDCHSMLDIGNIMNYYSTLTIQNNIQINTSNNNQKIININQQLTNLGLI